MHRKTQRAVLVINGSEMSKKCAVLVINGSEMSKKCTVLSGAVHFVTFKDWLFKSNLFLWLKNCIFLSLIDQLNFLSLINQGEQSIYHWIIILFHPLMTSENFPSRPKWPMQRYSRISTLVRHFKYNGSPSLSLKSNNYPFF